MHRAFVAALCVVSAAVTGCASTSTGDQAGRSPAASPTAPSPSHVRTIVRDTHVVAAGTAVRLDAQPGVVLRLSASVPSSSRTRLSTTHGYPPAHGFYVTFRMTIANLGSKPVMLGPGNFVVVIAHEGRLTSYDGNAPYSGAPAQLDTTEIDPGDVVRAPLTFDVRRPHGTLLFVPDTSAAIAWRF